jgi:hypothetical protein
LPEIRVGDRSADAAAAEGGPDAVLDGVLNDVLNCVVNDRDLLIQSIQFMRAPCNGSSVTANHRWRQRNRERFSVTLHAVGAEADCRVTIGGTTTEGKALLETDELIFRGAEFRLSIPYHTILSVDASNGILRITSDAGVAAFALGEAAAKWADRIRNPPRRIDKLGIKTGQRVLLVGLRDVTFREEIETSGATVLARGTVPADVIFLAVHERGDLERLGTLQRFMARDGAIWVIRPKGSPAISEADVIQAGRDAGLVDVKVVRFSDTHTAEKFVIPVARR